MVKLEIPPGYALASVPIKHDSQPRTAYVTIGVDVSAAGGAYGTVADSITTRFDSAFKDQFDTQVQVGPTLLSVGSDGDERLAVAGTTSFRGTQDGDMEAANAALLIKKYSSRGGRRGRGRMYLPWILVQADVSDVGIVSSTRVTTLQSRANSFLTGFTSATPSHPMVLLHTPSDDDVDNPTVTGSPNVVVSLLVDPLIGTQRRRLGR